MNFLNKKENKTNYIKFGRHTYCLNLEKLKEVCLSASKDGGVREIQIAQTYEVDDDNELNLLSKVEHETKTIGSAQNDMIVYDIFKLLLIVLLEDSSSQKDFQPAFNTALAINTLLNWGVLEEIN